MRVELRRAEVRVPEHLLDAAEVGAALQEVGGERVAEEMRVHALRVEPGLGGESLQDQESARARERSSLCVEEQLRPPAAVEVRAAAGEVTAHGFHRLPAERDDPLLVALADAANEPVLEVDAGAFQ